MTTKRFLVIILLPVIVAVSGIFIPPRQAELIPGVVIEYFDIHGHTESEWREYSVQVAGAMGNDNALAWTNYGAIARWECIDGNAENLSMDIPIQVFLPRLLDLDNSNSVEWNRYFAMLVAHENQHVYIVESHTTDYLGINGMPCDEVMQKVKTIFGFISLLNKQYDEEI